MIGRLAAFAATLALAGCNQAREASNTVRTADFTWGERTAGVSRPPPAHPLRVMSTNQCVDLLVLQLLPRDRIASVSWLAADVADSIRPGLMDGVAVNHALAEDIVAQKPDLLLVSVYTTPTIRRMAAMAGVPMVEVDDAITFDDIRRVTRQVGLAVGEPARAEAMLAQMDAKLAALAARPKRPVTVVAWNGGLSVPGRSSLADAIIEAAGGVNIAARPGFAQADFGLEELALARPQALLYGEGQATRPSLRNEQATHRLVRAAYAGRRIRYPEVMFGCGLPQAADMATDLRDAFDRLPLDPSPHPRAGKEKIS
jgi:iron complex transport system substrate-binding protein